MSEPTALRASSLKANAQRLRDTGAVSIVHRTTDHAIAVVESQSNRRHTKGASYLVTITRLGGGTFATCTCRRSAQLVLDAHRDELAAEGCKHRIAVADELADMRGSVAA